MQFTRGYKTNANSYYYWTSYHYSSSSKSRPFLTAAEETGQDKKEVTGKLPFSLRDVCVLEREEGREGERGKREKSMWERNVNQLPPIHAPTREWTCNLDMCPDEGSNPQRFWNMDDTPT